MTVRLQNRIYDKGCVKLREFTYRLCKILRSLIWKMLSISSLLMEAELRKFFFKIENKFIYFKRRNINSSLIFDKAFKGIIENWTFHSINEGSLKITFKVPLNQSYDKRPT